jgi:hypothetical protein
MNPFARKHRNDRPIQHLRFVENNPPAIASWLNELRRIYRDATPREQLRLADQGQRLQALYIQATGHRYP